MIELLRHLDLHMLQFTGGPSLPALRLLLLHDDADREFSYVAGAERALEAPRAQGWAILSMRDDWHPNWTKCEFGESALRRHLRARSSAPRPSPEQDSIDDDPQLLLMLLQFMLYKVHLKPSFGLPSCPFPPTGRSPAPRRQSGCGLPMPRS